MPVARRANEAAKKTTETALDVVSENAERYTDQVADVFGLTGERG
jgi:hypothetical protein